MKKLIITADDFGIFPSINEGVKESVLLRKVNSVAAISNYKDSVKNVKELIETAGDKIEIGCHLTISSGKPILGFQHEAFTSAGYFRTFDNLKITQLEKNTELLEKELKAQVLTFIDSGIKVSNLSCHHTTLTFTPKLFNVYTKVAESFNFPMRSVDIIPFGKDNTYRSILQFLLLGNVPVTKLKEIKRFGTRITDHLKNEAPQIKTPSVLDSRHYGPAPFVEIMNFRVKELVRKKQSDISDFLEEFISHNYESAELMLHLIKDEINLREKDNEIDYPGISQKYFDSRNIEFLSINSFNFDPYLKRIEMGSWRDLK